jgi:hypothetical protein
LGNKTRINTEHQQDNWFQLMDVLRVRVLEAINMKTFEGNKGVTRSRKLKKDKQ